MAERTALVLGGETAHALTRHGRRVRALARDPNTGMGLIGLGCLPQG